jgi:two-component system phosphate regulon response regulator OmpR
MGISKKSYADLPHVLIVDDDDRIRQLVSRYLREHNFVVNTAHDAAQAKLALDRIEVDALVLDVMMPGQNGLDLTKEIRENSEIPILLLTALGESSDRITGLESGADDYLPKPFEPRELVLRLQSIMKRQPKIKPAENNFLIGAWKYDNEFNELRSEEETVRLTSVEGNLLRALASRAGEPISREELARICNLEGGERTIDVQVTRLRRKIEPDTKAPRYLQTVRGKGYLLRIERL